MRRAGAAVGATEVKRQCCATKSSELFQIVNEMEFRVLVPNSKAIEPEITKLMELLGDYDSSEEEDAEVPPDSSHHTTAAAAVVTQHERVQPALIASSELEQRRRVIAQALAHQAHDPHFRHMQRRRMTSDERAFEFRGYVSKRQRRSTDEQARHAVPPQLPPVEVLPPLFSARSDGHSDGGDDDDDSTGPTLPSRITHRLTGHTNAVNCVQWSPTHAHLFLSASMDSSVRIWDCQQQLREICRRTLTHHLKGVKSAKWALDGSHILSGGYDGSAIYTDAETVTAVHTYHHQLSDRQPVAVTSVCVHPSDPNLFLTGTDKGCIYSYDLRQPVVCRTFQKAFGDVHDMLFLPGDSERFVSSAGVKYRDASHQTLLVWDFRSTTLLFDRLDRDMQPFRCLRLHPHEPRFVAQSSGDFALFFSAKEPYKRVNKGRLRFDGGHQIQGFSIQCSFNGDGMVLATGDADGRVFYYDTLSKRVLKRLQAFDSKTACLCAEFQTLARNARLVAGAFDGQLLLYE